MKILKNTHLQYKETAFSNFLWDKKPLSFRHKIYHERRIFLRNKNNFIDMNQLKKGELFVEIKKNLLPTLFLDLYGDLYGDNYGDF